MLKENHNRLSKFDEYLTIAEAARHMGVSASTLRNWDRKGKLKAARHPVNGYRLYNREELDKLLNKIIRRKSI